MVKDEIIKKISIEQLDRKILNELIDLIYIIDKIKGNKKAKLNINLITIIVSILFIIYFLMPKI